MKQLSNHRKCVFLLVMTAVCSVGLTVLAFHLLGSRHNEPIGRIAYIKSGYGWPEIYVMDANGAHGKIANLGTLDGQSIWSRTPTWAPDGRHLAFGCYPAGPNTAPGNICLVDIDGRWAWSGEPVQTLIDWNNIPGGFCSEVEENIGASISWSADGERLAFTCQGAQDNSVMVCVVNLDGDLNCWSVPPKHDVNALSWSPNDEKLVIGYTDADYKYKIYLVNLDGTDQVYIAEGYDPAWSPNGKKIAFSNHNSIYTVEPDGSNQQVVLQYIEKFGEELFLGPNKLSWSPDGRYLAFVASWNPSDPKGSSSIYTINIKNRKVQLLTIEGDGIFESPDWSPRK